MNKDDLADVLASSGAAESKAAGRRTVDMLFERMAGALKSGDEVSIHGFGAFKVKQRAARTARNPHSGETIQVAAKKAVTFKAASALKASVQSTKAKK